MMMRLILVAIVFLFSHHFCYADYKESELFVIEWGEENYQFKASPYISNVDEGTPEDSTDDHFMTGGGPYKAFVDNNGNFIFASSRRQLKGFSNSGELLFDFSPGSPEFLISMYRGDPIDIFVDSQKHLYVTAVPPLSYVPVIDYENITIDSLRPFLGNTKEPISAINWTYDGRIMFFSYRLGLVTYDDGEIVPGGSPAIMSEDGFFRIAYFEPPDIARIYYFVDPDTSGINPASDSLDVELGVEGLVHLELLNSMEPSHLYLIVYYYTDFSYFEIWQFDLEYNLIDKVIPPAEAQYYSSVPKPFITSNGDIYEFRTREDGLHVIRWSKE